MKKTMITGMMAVLLTTLGFSQFSLDFWGEMSSPSQENFSVDAVSRALEQESSRMAGFGMMTVIQKTGYGTRSLVRIQKEEVKGWTADFQSTFGISHHLFGAGAGFGLYGEAGLGAAGKVDLIRGMDAEEITLADLQLSVFPYLAVGASLTLDNFLIGARADFHTFNIQVPGTPLDTYPLSRFQFGIYAGFTTGRIDWEKLPFVKPLPPVHRVRIRVEEESPPATPAAPATPAVPEAAPGVPRAPEPESVTPPTVRNDRERARDLVRDAQNEDF